LGTGFLTAGKSGRGVKLITQLHLVPWLRIRVAVLPPPNTSSLLCA
jgi:hypothetical protein